MPSARAEAARASPQRAGNRTAAQADPERAGLHRTRQTSHYLARCETGTTPLLRQRVFFTLSL